MSTLQLPLYIEYIKALGPTIVALIAASIAGVIAYRQWKTARNKLKLDLFDKRLTIYNTAFEAIKWMAEPMPENNIAISNLAVSYAHARWLLDREVADHLRTLFDRSRNLKKGLSHDFSSMNKEQKLVQIHQDFSEARDLVSSELKALDDLFAPYLSIQH